MSEYKTVKIGKLKLKGEKTKKHKKRKRVDGEPSLTGSSAPNEEQKDTSDHGGWWKTTAAHQIRGDISIQIGRLPVYISAMDDGTFTIGPPHDEGDGPSPQEILTALPTGDARKVSFKSGYGRYVGLDNKGRVVARAEAIGPREMWTPVYQDGDTALLSSTECFVGLDDDDAVTATDAAVTADHHRLTIRSNSVRAGDAAEEIPFDEQGSLKEVEMKHIRKFQKFQDKRTKVNPDGRVELRDAKNKGKLHESLLDRRSKMKADRYCK